MREARYYTKLKEGDNLQCQLCSHNCIIAPGKTGRCRVRKNEQSRLITINYGLCSSLALDPIEKKPLYHFFPGYNILSLGSFGCNLSCGFCQNWEISQRVEEGRILRPEDIVILLKEIEENCCGVAYTYSEPSVWFEFVEDSSRLVQASGFKNVLVTNGMLNEVPLRDLLEFIDALNIDLKAFTEEFYRKQLGGSLKQVLKTIEICQESGKHLEITTLLIPGLNDSRTEIKSLAKWLSELSADIPLHLSRCFPRYKFNRPATPFKTLLEAREIAREYLNYVYLGNLGITDYADTNCIRCGQLLIRRTGYFTQLVGLNNGVCASCGYRPPLKGVV